MPSQMPISSHSPNSLSASRPLALAGLALSGILGGALLGGVTNAVNGVVSPWYFRKVLGWDDVPNLWRAIVAQGVFEGLLFGIAFSLVFSVGTGIITGAACSYRFALKHLLGVLGGAGVFWMMGGMAGMGLASFSPEFYKNTFIGVPEDDLPMIRFAWVGGSIWGVEFGGLLSVVVGLVIVRANWRYQLAVERPREVSPS